jgi:hypothetical protein
MGRLIQFTSAKGAEPEHPLEFVYVVCRSDNAQFATEFP